MKLRGLGNREQRTKTGFQGTGSRQLQTNYRHFWIMAHKMHLLNCLLKTFDFVKGKNITNFVISKTGKGRIFALERSFFKKKVCTSCVHHLYAICTLDRCVSPSFHQIIDIFETDFRRFLNILRLRILKDSKILRLIDYEKGLKSPDFFMLK